VWLLANFACFNAGHVEPAVVLIGGLNMAAAIHALARQRRLADWAVVLGRISGGTILFLGLTMPMWMSFLDALKGSFSLHSAVRVVQLHAASFPGVFDDIFFLLPRKSDIYPAVAPGTSLLVMVGVVLAALRWRQLKGEPFFWVNSGAILLWGGCIFGWVPASILGVVPMINRVGHTETDFSYLLVIHLTLQSAYGFNCLARETSFRRVAKDLFWVGLIFTGMLLIYSLGLTHRAIPWGYVACAIVGAVGAPLLFAYLKRVRRPASVAGWAGILILGFVPQYRFGLYTFGDENLLMIPGPRAVLNAPSQSIQKIQADASGPFRAVGLEWILPGDYSAVYGLEDIRSCAPLSSGPYIDLFRKFPGVDFGGEDGWGIEIVNPVAAQPLLNLLNVRYVLAPPSVQFGEQTRDALNRLAFRVSDRSDFLVLENMEVWPRAFFTDKLFTNSSTETFTKQLLNNARQPFVSVSANEIKNQPGLLPLENTKNTTVVSASHYQLLPNSTAFDIHASSAGVVCLTEGQARDFTATANNKPITVLTVNRAFKGVFLDRPGDYHIEFTYRPHDWRLACAFFWTALGCVVVLAFMGCRVRDGRKPVATL
ncbi:MAG TPA: hypothetical protein VFY06_10935, partial [Verrucomicrobiae bacterium]|nr:hypothetical protein [Verrucomicrobiae bacterium]